MKIKKCSKCKQIKSIDEFYKNKARKDGYHIYCKQCHIQMGYIKGLYQCYKNKYIHLSNGITKIIITSSKYGIKECLIDTEDYEKVKKYWWCVHKTKNGFYVVAHNKNNNHKDIRLHRLVMNVYNTMFVDHIFHNGLDNRKIKLRICTRNQNQMNRIKQLNNTYSKYKGVSFKKETGKWSAQIAKYKKDYHLGYFKTELDAAKRYDCAARILHGEFAHPNFPDKRIA